MTAHQRASKLIDESLYPYPMSESPDDRPPRSKLARVAKIVTVTLLLIMTAIVAAAWFSASTDDDLRFDYEGFD